MLWCWCRRWLSETEILLHLEPYPNVSVTSGNQPLEHSITFGTRPSNSFIIGAWPNYSTMLGTIPKISGQMEQTIVLEQMIVLHLVPVNLWHCQLQDSTLKTPCHSQVQDLTLKTPWHSQTPDSTLKTHGAAIGGVQPWKPTAKQWCYIWCCAKTY